ncbi:MAG: ligand-binding sensor domain-containing protein [Calditrichia bacterium]
MALRILYFALILQLLPGLPGATLNANEQRKFERIDYEKGLSQNHITAIHQDRQGYMWFGTSDGLVCYDGYSFISFRYNPRDTSSISGNYINSIFEDSYGKLWVGTSGGGINCYNPDTQLFRHFRKNALNDESLSDNDVTCIYEDRQRRLWIGTKGGGLNRFIRDRKVFQRYRGSEDGLGSDLISTIYQDRNNRLWVGTSGNGLSMAELRDNLSEADTLSLDFRRFGASKELYVPQLTNRVKELLGSNSPIATRLHPGNNAEERIPFTIKEKTSVLVIAMGDGAAFVMRDYGFIRDAEDKRVWSMDRSKSTHAGGSRMNRLQLDLLELAPGDYQLGYISNGKHSFGAWEDVPPDDPLLWGIQLLPISAGDKAYIEELITRRDSRGMLPPGWITDIHEDYSGGIWIATTRGLAKYLEDGSDSFEVFSKSNSGLNILIDGYIREIYADPSPASYDLWLLMENGSITRFNRRSRHVQQYNYSENTDRLAQGLSGPDANMMHFDRQGKLWVGTEQNGLNELTLSHPIYGTPFARPRFKSYENQPNNDRSLSDNEITSMFEDRSGQLWIGTKRGGLNKVNIAASKFKYFGAGEEGSGLSHPVVTSILQDAAKRLWVGTLGGGLNLLEVNPAHPSKFLYTYFRADSDNPTALGGDAVTCLLEDQSGSLWVGTLGAGLYRMDRASGTFKGYRYDPENSNSLSSDDINTIYEDQYGQIWIGTNRGLNQLDGFRETFKRYTVEPDNAGTLSNNEVRAISEDLFSNGRTLWIGTQSGGLNSFDRKSEWFKNYTQNFDDPNSLNNAAIWAIQHDVAGNVWFGTYSGGLNRFDREQEKFHFITEEDGLANNSIRAILEDDFGNLWLSTNEGISRFNPHSGSVRNYDVSDGLQSNEFSAGAAFRAPSGEMFFGGINGFNAFFPDSVKDNEHIPPIVVADFKINNLPAKHRLHEAETKKEPLYLNYDENALYFAFAALDYVNPAKNSYLQILTNSSGDTLSELTGRVTSYPGLKPGEFHLKVLASNNDGVWNRDGFQLRIVVSPPWWQTTWFRILSALLLLGLAVAYYKIRVRRKLRLEQVRMQENERVRAKAAHDFHDELGHKLTKINLFSEIVQRNPSVTPEVKDYLTRISENTKGLSGGMRDFIWTLDPDKDSLHEVGVRLKDFGDELFDKTGVAFRVAGMTEEMEQAHLTTDWRRHLVLIFKEAMNNALKHGKCSNVTLNLELKDSLIEVVLTDDGQGLPKDMLAQPNGTESDFALESSGGNGMRNMRIRASKLGGEIIVASSGNGTILKFRGKMPQTGN